MEAPGVECGVRERGSTRMGAGGEGISGGSAGLAGVGEGGARELATVMRVALEKLEAGDVETAKVLLRLATVRA
jgi:hypothetical protein